MKSKEAKMEEAIHRYKAREARRTQLLNYEAELQLASIETPIPYFYPDTRPKFSIIRGITRELLNLLKI